MRIAKKKNYSTNVLSNTFFRLTRGTAKPHLIGVIKKKKKIKKKAAKVEKAATVNL